jgi:hypothetical protein
MAHQKIKELYYSYNLVANETPIWCNVHIMHIDVINHVWLSHKFTLIACGNYITTSVNVTSNQSTTLQLMYDINTYNHVMCMHFNCPLNLTLITNCQLSNG